MKHHSTLKKKKKRKKEKKRNSVIATAWMNLKGIMLREVSQTKTNMHGIAYTWGKDYNAYKLNRMVVGRNWERLVNFWLKDE